MKVKCILLTYQYGKPNIPFLEKLHDYLEIGKIYDVYGLCIWKRTLNYLIDNPSDGQMVCAEWHHAEVFEVIDSILPNNMYFYFSSPEDKREISALWGYKEMIDDFNHYTDLTEIKDEAVEIFYKRKQEIDEQFRQLKT